MYETLWFGDPTSGRRIYRSRDPRQAVRAGCAGSLHASEGLMGSSLVGLIIHMLDRKFAFGMGAAVGAGLMAQVGGPRQDPDAPDLCGTYRLESSEGAESGHVVYEADGTMSSHVVRRSAAAAPDYVGVHGKWWVHNSRTAYAATYPPHDGSLVEHQITAASDARLVGKNEVQRYQLSPDGQQLTCSVVQLQDGRPEATSTTRWRRVL